MTEGKGGSGFEIAAWELWHVDSGFCSAVCSASSANLSNGAVAVTPQR